jgi:hypothetical protein
MMFGRGSRKKIVLESRAIIPPSAGAEDQVIGLIDEHGTKEGEREAASTEERRRRLRRSRTPRQPQAPREPRPPLWWRPIAVIAAVIVLISVLGTFVRADDPTQTAAAVTLEPIQSSVLLCPEPGSGGDLGVRVTAAVIPGQPGQTSGPGRAGLETLPGKESAKASIREPGSQAQIEAFGAKLPAIRAFGEGSLAPGLVADQWGRDPSGQGRGLASTSCAPAASEFWFVGGGAVAGRQTKVVLVNPDDSSAVVDVIIHGPEGIVDAPASRGLVIPAQDRSVVRLDVLAPGITATAFHVIARTGRIGASVDDEQRSGLQSVGVDWIPQSAPPATKVYVPGVLSGDKARVLSVVSTTDNDAIVSIRLFSAEGAYEPFERNQLIVPAGAVATMDMSSVMPPNPDGFSGATIELTSDQPIVAGMRQFFGGTRVQDETSFSAGAQSFTATSAVSGLPVRDATDVRLYITAPDVDAAVDVVLLPYRGARQVAEPTAPRRVVIKAGEMKNFALDAPVGIEWFTAVVTPAPGSGPIVIAHRIREKSRFGDLVTGYPWTPLRTQVSVPVAQYEQSVALR